MRTIYSLLTLCILLILPVLAMAQADPGGDPGTPIDGGISVLVAAGVGYGVKKYRQHHKKPRR